MARRIVTVQEVLVIIIALVEMIHWIIKANSQGFIQAVLLMSVF